MGRVRLEPALELFTVSCNARTAVSGGGMITSQLGQCSAGQKRASAGVSLAGPERSACSGGKPTIWVWHSLYRANSFTEQD